MRNRAFMEGRIYLDHAATTPVRDEVVSAMLPYFGATGFNASSLHTEGRAARAGLDTARASVARTLGARSREIVFTSGGSEADNLAILGTARARRAAGDHVVTVATEHHAVLHAAEALREDGFAVTVLPVDAAGRLDPRVFAAALRPTTILAAVMLANNELGTIQPIAELSAIARTHNVTFHCDAVQAPGRIAFDVETLGVDLLALSAHKFYGPKGVGVLYVRTGTPLAASILGGNQEAGLRAGTENVAGIVGLARALELGTTERPAEALRVAALRDRFEKELVRRIPGSRVNARSVPRLPNVSSITFAGVEARTLLVALDLGGVAVSAGSACAAGSLEPSHVLAAIGLARSAALETVRFSFGRLSSEAATRRAVEVIVAAVAACRDASREMGTTQPGLVAARHMGVSV